MTNNKVTLKDVYQQIDLLRQDIEERYVTYKEFKPVKGLVYGFVILILTAVATALVAQVVTAK